MVQSISLVFVALETGTGVKDPGCLVNVGGGKNRRMSPSLGQVQPKYPFWDELFLGPPTGQNQGVGEGRY